jgi:hypothetical protein
MGLLDRFRSQPAWKHADAGVRSAAVDALPLEEQDLLAAIAAEDEDARVRRTAVARLMQPAALARAAERDADERVRETARAMLRDIACGAFDGLSDADVLAALSALSDPRELAAVAKDAPAEATARAALDRLADPRAIAAVARQAQFESVRLAAMARVADPADLATIALKSEHKDVGLRAVEQIADREALETIAARARTKNVARRARALLRALDGQSSSTEPIEAGAEAFTASRPQQLDLCRSVDALLRADEWDTIDARLTAAQAEWNQLMPDVDEDLADRFAEACGAARERLVRHQHEEAAEARRRLEVQPRLVLCEQVEALDGPDALDRLTELEAQWATLAPLDEASEGTAALDARFDAARQACRARVESWQSRRERAAAIAGRLDEIEPTLATADMIELGRRWSMLHADWQELQTAADAALAERVARVGAQVREREDAARAAREQEDRDNLQKARQRCEQLEQAAAAPTLTLKQADRRLREVKAYAADLPRFPTRHDRDEIAHRLKTIQATLFQRVQELREIDDWQRWANASVQEELCAKMEALATAEDLDAAARELHGLQERWKQVSAAPREKAQELWTRFRTAQDAVRERLQTHFAEQAAKRAENLTKKEALCERAEALAESTDWIRTAEALKAMQAEWKTIGPVPRGNEKAIWERFRVACDTFFTRRHADLAERKEVWSANLAKKEALCAAVEALAESTDDWEHVLAEIKRLQAEWKTIGPVRKNRSEVIWQRFRAACDACFERRAAHGRADLEARLQARETICQELEALVPPEPSAAEGEAPSGEAVAAETVGSETMDAETAPNTAEAVSPAAEAAPPENLLATVRGLRQRWQQAGSTSGLPREEAARLADRFNKAFDRVLKAWPAVFAKTELDRTGNVQRLEELCVKVERLVSASGPRDVVASPATRLAEMLREALAANTIGGRVDEDARWRATAEEVKRAQAAWAKVGPVPEEARRRLSGRFQRACRRFFEERDQRRKMSNVS